MGRRRFSPMSYRQITDQTEKTVNMLMMVARGEKNSGASKEQSVSRALGAVVLWEDLTSGYANTEDDKRRLYGMLNP